MQPRSGVPALTSMHAGSSEVESQAAGMFTVVLILLSLLLQRQGRP